MSKLYSREAIEAAKDRLLIPELWRRLDPPGQPKGSCHSPFREDRHASFTIFNSGRAAHDFATGDTFDGPAFVAKALGLSSGAGLKRFLELAGGDTNEILQSEIPRAVSRPSENQIWRSFGCRLMQNFGRSPLTVGFVWLRRQSLNGWVV